MHHLPARLLERRERNEVSIGNEAGLFGELALGGGKRFLAGLELALGNRPGTFVFLGPKGTAGVHEKDFAHPGVLAIQQQSCALFRQLQTPHVRAHAVGAVARAAGRRGSAHSSGAEHEGVAGLRDGPAVNRDADRRTTATSTSVPAVTAVAAMSTVAASADSGCVLRRAESPGAALAGKRTEAAVAAADAAARLDRVARDLQSRQYRENAEGTAAAVTGNATAATAPPGAAAAGAVAAAGEQERVQSAPSTTAAATTARFAIPSVESIRRDIAITPDPAQLGAAQSVRSCSAVEGIAAIFARWQRARRPAGAASSALASVCDVGPCFSIRAGVTRTAPAATGATDGPDDVSIEEATIDGFRATLARGQVHTAGRSVEPVRAWSAIDAIRAVEATESFAPDDVISGNDQEAVDRQDAVGAPSGSGAVVRGAAYDPDAVERERAGQVVGHHTDRATAGGDNTRDESRGRAIPRRRIVAAVQAHTRAQIDVFRVRARRDIHPRRAE